MVYKEPRPKVVPGSTTRVRLTCGNLYVAVTHKDHKIFEVFAWLGKSGGCAMASLAALTVSITMGLRYEVPAQVFIDKLKGIKCQEVSWDEYVEYTSCADAIAKVMEKTQGELGCNEQA